MNKITPRNLKGFRDFLPTDARKREFVIQKLKSVFESYGFEPLETPTLEYEEILTGKYGDEGDQLMYKFKDNGDRDVAMRYDQTVPLARVVAQNGEKLPMPFKRYQIQNVFRADNTQKGRFREFLQCDIDTVGTNSSLSDAEIIQVVYSTLRTLNVPGFKININDREIFAGVSNDAITTIDKLKKIGEDGVRDELKSKGIDENLLNDIKMKKPTPRIDEVFEKLDELGINNAFYEFSPTLARGLNYYTGIIIEVEIDDYNAGSIGGGGRYDELIGMFLEKQIPAVGFAFGFDRLVEAMTELNLFPDSLYTSKVLILNSQETEKKALDIANLLRLENIKCEVYLDNTADRGKQFSYADRKNIPFTLIINGDDLGLGSKDKETGKIRKVNCKLDEVIALLSQ